MKNNISLQVLLGILFLSISIFICSVIFVDVIYQIGDFKWDGETVTLALLGIMYLVAAIGLIGRYEWARLLASMVLWASMAAWGYLMWEELSYWQRDDIFLLAVSMMVIAGLVAGLLLLGNTSLMTEGKRENSVTHSRNDILDL